jgi:hypothetical protein
MKPIKLFLIPLLTYRLLHAAQPSNPRPIEITEVQINYSDNQYALKFICPFIDPQEVSKLKFYQTRSNGIYYLVAKTERYQRSIFEAPGMPQFDTDNVTTKTINNTTQFTFLQKKT